MLVVGMENMRWNIFGRGILVVFIFLIFATLVADAQETIRNASGHAIGFRFVGTEADVSAQLRHAANSDDVLEVFIGGHEVKGEEIDYLHKFKCLDTLSIGNSPDEISQISNGTLESIVQLRSLKYLELNVHSSTDVSWSIIEDAKSLVSLTIYGQVKFENDDIIGIASLRQLESLSLDGNFDQVDNLRSLRNNRSLTLLSLKGGSVNKLLDSVLATGLGISQLELPTVKVSVEQLRQVEVMCGQHLRLLEIGFSDVRCFSMINEFENLTNLAVIMPESYSVELTRLKLPPKLETFVIRNE
jgi:hypothetical protein